MSDLVKSLRRYASQEWGAGTELQSLLIEAADRIEAQDKRIEELQKELGWAAEWYGESWVYNHKDRPTKQEQDNE